MRRSRSLGELLFDPEIEKTLRQLRRERRAFEGTQNSNMAEENEQNHRAMKDYLTPNLEGCSSSIVRPPVQANNFELKSCWPDVHTMASLFGCKYRLSIVVYYSLHKSW